MNLLMDTQSEDTICGKQHTEGTTLAWQCTLPTAEQAASEMHVVCFVRPENTET